MRKYWMVLGLASALIFLIRCTEGNDGLIIIPDEPYELLSEYNFFKGALSELEPNDRVLPYDLNSPLFSDYAHKARFVWMPEGSGAHYTLDHVLEFPTGTALIKNFYYYHDETDHDQGRKIIETRILISRGESWDAYGYIWNDEQTDATYDIIGGIQEISWIDEAGASKNVNYIIPNMNQCKGCHAYDNLQKPIGPKVRNLNKDFEYASGAMNQLKKWSEVGYLTGYVDNAEHPSVAVWDDPEEDLHARAMAYLDINCGHCHQEKGAANTSGLTLLADSQVGTTLGIYKPTVSAGAGTGGHTYSIVPGNPQESIMIYRMKSDNPGAMMPELGRRLIHEEGVALIADWINEMNPNDFDSASRAALN